MALPLGVFVCGAETVIASLWKVDDRATALLMTRFYENWLGKAETVREIDGKAYNPGNAIPKLAALREAQQWLRHLTASEIRQLLRIKDDAEWASYLSAHRGFDPAKTVKSESSQLAAAADAERLFEHPYYWAAFILIGALE